MRHSVTELRSSMLHCLESCQVEPEKAFSIADVLLEGELLGHRTHGLLLFKPYVESILNGKMQVQGWYNVLQQLSASQLWDGQYLPGPWLVRKGIDVAMALSNSQGTGTIVIQRAHHIGCLAAYLEAVARNGRLLLIACSDPINRTVAPYGGTTGVYSPNPLAMGIPTSSDPILIDTSMSTTANGLVNMTYQQGKRLPHPWLQTKEGELTDDPATFFETPPSTIVPLGGVDAGYKGFALGIMIEAITNALGGHGRAAHPDRWGASVFIQVINPDAFSGPSVFLQEVDYLKSNVLASDPVHPDVPVRLPGMRGLELKAKQLTEGIEVDPGWFQWLSDFTYLPKQDSNS